MSRLVAAVGLLALAGCTSIKLVQREGCWVRRTEAWPGRVTEELGPCVGPVAPPADDRVSRAVQDCAARADHRWQMRAQLAWSRGEPLPAPDADDGVFRACMEDPAKALAGDVEQLRRREEEASQHLAEVAKERDELRARADEERRAREEGMGARLTAQEKLTDRLLAGQEKVGERLLQGQGAMAAYLGEAAKKSSQPAVANASATSRSEGTAATDAAATSPAAGAAGRPVSRVQRRAASCGPGTEAGPGTGAGSGTGAGLGTGPGSGTVVGPAPDPSAGSPPAKNALTGSAP